jgi:hypothetical protein
MSRVPLRDPVSDPLAAACCILTPVLLLAMQALGCTVDVAALGRRYNAKKKLCELHLKVRDSTIAQWA